MGKVQNATFVIVMLNLFLYFFLLAYPTNVYDLAEGTIYSNLGNEFFMG